MKYLRELQLKDGRGIKTELDIFDESGGGLSKDFEYWMIHQKAISCRYFKLTEVSHLKE